MVGRTLEGRYTILARLGAGSMGTVYRAKQHAMGREVAIKILRGDRAIDDSAKARFMREARANSLLASPNTVTVFDFGESESGEFYLAMELLEGESLGQRLARIGRLPAPVAVDTARQALRSLAEAHAKGIIHRDLKPDNLFFSNHLTSAVAAAAGDTEIVKVLDFGIAKLVRDDEDSQPMGVVETQAGTVFGTPRYMSPEQAQGKPLDARSDLYSLGVILYQMLTGRPPFTDNDAIVVMARHIKSTPKRPNEVTPEANVPRELEDIVMRALAKDPNERPSNADVMAGQLLAALEAHGALSSGIRASVTNAAGIRVPDSMRPPPVPLPGKAKAKLPLWTLAAVPVALLVVIATASMVLALRGSSNTHTMTERHRAAPAKSFTLPVLALPTDTLGASAVQPPTVTPDSLPRAQPIVTSKPPLHGGKPVSNPRTKASQERRGVFPNERGPNEKGPPPPTSSTSSYGIFEN